MGISFTRGEISVYYAVRIPNLRQRLRRWRGPCPIHRGKHDSFSVDPDTGLWICFSTCGRGGDIIGLEKELSGGDFLTARRNVYSIVGRDLPKDDRGFRSSEEGRRFAQRRASARDLAESARRWQRAILAALQSKKDSEAAFTAAWIASCRTLASSERMSPREVLEAYIRAAREEPEDTARCIKWAEEEERECARITAAVVRLIVAAEKVHHAA